MTAAPKPTGFHTYLPTHSRRVSARRLSTPADCRKARDHLASLGMSASLIVYWGQIAGLIVSADDAPEWQLARAVTTFAIGQWVVIDNNSGVVSAMNDDEFIPSFRLA
jgi:hypothetical protein